MFELLKMTFSSSIPIILAGLGGLFTNITNTLNIGLEGLMLLSAFLTLIFAQYTSSILLGILLSCLACVGFSLLMAFIYLNLRANLFILGLATNLMAAGLTVFLSDLLLGVRGTIVFEKLTPTSDSSVIFFAGHVLTVGFVTLSWLTLRKTNFGHRIKVIGKGFELAKRFGIDVKKNVYLVYTISGVLGALAGTSLSLPLRAFVTGMTNGRGWIALVAVIIAKDNPLKLVVAALLFGFASTVTNFLQVLTHIPQEFLLSFPFFFSLMVLILYSRREKT